MHTSPTNIPPGTELLSSKLPFWGTPTVTLVWNSLQHRSVCPQNTHGHAPRAPHRPWLFSRCTAWTGPPSVRSCPPPCTVGQSPLCPSLCSSETDYPGGGLPAAQRSPFWSVIQTETEKQHLRKTLLISHSLLLWKKELTYLHQRGHINITYHCNLEQSLKLWI